MILTNGVVGSTDITVDLVVKLQNTAVEAYYCLEKLLISIP